MSGITAVVPVWNGRALLERLLRSLEGQTRPASELVVVDNGSTDGAPELARARGARVIPMGRNEGFAAAVNRGIQASGGEWIAVLNSDVELDAGYFETLLAAASAPDIWFATGKILSYESTQAETPALLDGCFDLLSRGGTAWRAGNGRADGPAFSCARQIYSAPWTAALFRAELFRRVGVLETSFESYLEDVDFGLRCALAGYAGLYVPTAIARHRGSATLGRWHPETVRRISRNQVFLVKRHYPRHALVRCAWPILAAQLLWGALAARHGAALAWVRGKWEGIRGHPGACKESQFHDSRALETLLRSNEHAIRNLQAASEFDWYWRVYLLLTRGEAN